MTVIPLLLGTLLRKELKRTSRVAEKYFINLPENLLFYNVINVFTMIKIPVSFTFKKSCLKTWSCLNFPAKNVARYARNFVEIKITGLIVKNPSFDGRYERGKFMTLW